jgi:transcriptional regulator with XRE-family HTH domain
MKRPLLPAQEKTLMVFGENIKLARLRRHLSSEQVAERAGISRSTLIKVEKGDEGVALGYYFRVLAVLGLDKDLLLVAKDDELGRALQDAKLLVKKRIRWNDSTKK